METYIDRHSGYHDKPSINGEPSSNNLAIYTAYSKNLGFELNYFKLKDCYDLCKETASDNSLYFMYRLPDKQFPILSRDEILGWVSLGLDPLDYGWFMYRHTKKESIFMYLYAIYGLWKIRKEHRNYFWENEMLDLYPVAMKLAWHDRHYVNVMQDKPRNLFYLCMFQLYALTTILGNNTSAKNVLTLQIEDMKSKFWIRFIDKKGNYLEYFGEEHIFNG